MILARHAEALFWAGRYLERGEVTSRQLDVSSRAALHTPLDLLARVWLFPVKTLGLITEFGAVDRAPDETTVSGFLLCDDDNPGSVERCVAMVRENLRVARERVPVELWEEISRLHLRLESVDLDRTAIDEPLSVYSLIRQGCQAVGGVIQESMTRDEGHAFIVMGRMIERSVFTSRLLAEAFREVDPPHPDLVLRCASSLQAFHRLQGHGGDLQAVAQFLVHARAVPRTVLAGIERLDGGLQIVGDADNIQVPRQLVGRLRSRLEYGDIAEQLASEPITTLEGLQLELLSIADTLSECLFYPWGMSDMTAQFVRPGRRTQ